MTGTDIARAGLPGGRSLLALRLSMAPVRRPLPRRGDLDLGLLVVWAASNGIGVEVGFGLRLGVMGLCNSASTWGAWVGMLLLGECSVAGTVVGGGLMSVIVESSLSPVASPNIGAEG